MPDTAKSARGRGTKAHRPQTTSYRAPCQPCTRCPFFPEFAFARRKAREITSVKIAFTGDDWRNCRQDDCHKHERNCALRFHDVYSPHHARAQRVGQEHPIAATRLEGHQAEAFSFRRSERGRVKRAVPQLQSGAPAGRHEASLGDVGNSPSFLLTRNWRSILQPAVWLVHSSQLSPPVSSLRAGFFFDA